MRIDEIVPYERNARNNEKAVPVVAESIREFGLRGQIVLESRERPVIVCGHTRVAACKSLGWDEIPDENIAFCDGMTDEQIKAFRLADNRTGEVATWNRALLKSEARALDKAGFDISRFKFDFKGKGRSYGAERLRTDDAYNLWMVDASICDGEGMPPLAPCDAAPSGLLPFNRAKTAKDGDFGNFVHFFVDDYQFERLWNKPEKYLPIVQRFAGALSPDFSCYVDMPYPMQRWNEYRRRALANYWQRNGVDVVPTLSWSDRGSFGFMIDGLPTGGTVAVSTVGVKRDGRSLSLWRDGMSYAMERLRPSRVIVYGGGVGFDFGSSEVIEFKANTSFAERR